MKFGVFFIVLLILFHQSSVSAASSSSFTLSPARILGGFFSNAVSALLKWVWSLKPTTKTAVSGRPMMRFESGYTVETVFDGSKLGIEPYAVEIAPTGDLLVLDSVNSNIYRIPPSLSRYTRPKLVAGSAEGYSGHVDGKPREARMNRPKALTVDDRGNIYVADTMNMVIRKISDTGVTTIAGGKWNRGGHSDGPSEDAKFSDDFEVVYVGSSCSLLVVDRGNQAIREIQLNFDDCAYQYGSSFPLGVAVLIGAALFGYMLALLQRRLMAYSDNEDELHQQLMAPMVKTNFQPINPPPPYQKQPKSTVRPPLIPSEDELEKQEEEEGLFSSVGKLFTGVGSFVSDLFGASRKKPNNNQQLQHANQTQYLQQQQQQQQQQWPVQDSYVIPNDEPPPPLEARTPTPRKTYAFMSKDAEKIHQLRHGRSYFNSWEGDLTQQIQQQQIQQQQMKQQIQQQQMKHQHLQQQRHYSLGPQTYYEQSCESTNEIVFGAVQESDKMRASMEIKAVNYGNSLYDNGTQHGFLRPRIGHGGGSGYNNRHPY